MKKECLLIHHILFHGGILYIIFFKIREIPVA